MTKKGHEKTMMNKKVIRILVKKILVLRMSSATSTLTTGETTWITLLVIGSWVVFLT